MLFLGLSLMAIAPSGLGLYGLGIGCPKYDGPDRKRNVALSAVYVALVAAMAAGIHRLFQRIQKIGGGFHQTLADRTYEMKMDVEMLLEYKLLKDNNNRDLLKVE